MKELEAIKARAEAATEGPWTPQEYDDNPGDQGVPIIGGGELGSMQGHLVAYAMTLSDEAQCEADGDFIAHARTDIPKLIAALEAVEVELADLDDIQAEHASFFDDPNVTAGSVAKNLRAAITGALQ